MIFLLSLSQAAAPPQPAKPLDGIPGVVARGETVQLIKEGFAFTEGPVPAPDGGIYFTDLLTSDRIHRMAPNGEITVFREQTNGANGLAVNRAGEVFTVEGSGKRVTRFAGGKATILTEGSAEKPLLAPNDLILDSKGGVYFSDPGPRPAVAGRIVYVYYLPAGAKQPIMLDDKIARPNGIMLTTDGKTLLVDDTVGDTIFAYDVQSDGSVKNKRPFARLHDIPAGENSGADGMALDRDNRLYVAALTGIQVFDKTGTYLGTIPVPRQPSNAAFSGPDKRTLYITAREGLYRLRMLSQGPDRPGK
ncbi:MAG TPA: SMP-30/gluconolactonase/LRE family protein [Terriglobia bacterium]|nr:SMP-30/gluconolactonase/LRE family protein [Terriglobia bacterium]